MKNYQVNKLEKAYKYRIKKLYKNIFQQKETSFNLFIEQLKYKRDRALIDSTTSSDLATQTFTVLVAALAEYDAYITSKKVADIETQKFHWNNFCEFFKQNGEDWLS
jgi:hypothetical protein